MAAPMIAARILIAIPFVDAATSWRLVYRVRVAFEQVSTTPKTAQNVRKQLALPPSVSGI